MSAPAPSPAPDHPPAPENAGANPPEGAPHAPKGPVNKMTSDFKRLIKDVWGFGKETESNGEGWSTLGKVAAGTTAAVAGAGLLTAAGLTYATVKVAEKAPTVAQNLLAGASEMVGRPFVTAGAGFTTGTKLLEPPEYQKLEGWTAPWKLLKNTLKATKDLTRLASGLVAGTAGLLYGVAAGIGDGLHKAVGGGGGKFPTPKAFGGSTKGTSHGTQEHPAGHDDHDGHGHDENGHEAHDAHATEGHGSHGHTDAAHPTPANDTHHDAHAPAEGGHGETHGHEEKHGHDAHAPAHRKPAHRKAA
ncbi:hypothetical protein IPG41_05725 [Candidatus Peregrinibacteria bacterium]|nr:MAG: hypothetical protein IPG41_05725 [Candidatus Peregrinibacteria bacterium]